MKKENSQIRLKKIMNDRGLRQVDILEKSKPFQDKLGIKMSKTHLSNYVNGKSNPDQQKLILLSQTLGVSEPWLMGYDVPMIEPRESENDSETIEETITVMKKLEEPRQKVVLDTASSQLEEQEKAKRAVKPKPKVTPLFDINSPLTDEELQEAVDEAVAFDGVPLTDREKELYKHLLRETWEEDHGRG
ncbi:helix-turn-helix domain-containing protein [Lactococcus lactis]|jgi:transcriptional regulator with XRE-family HTH domain|nr:helix-turn-helix domain-containing protein [Lactococcus lactis]MBU3885675.1 helix-turn-helix domain-containing protein [Lactococcus lactis]MBU7533467.1 helix-turn-helix domain-containing protein [Lactococcus lactis]MCT3121072.1 helix-turn-helix domain-containing protein [Lactococcus lactis]MDM7547602.1 helix-turn-helix domain-containing protein [Lactococcus lactis]MDM7659956.1 helix-turn-helix domain-containing protein [Lactococcus lactis]